jgi:tellurite resistance-related uncharacterized protein
MFRTLKTLPILAILFFTANAFAHDEPQYSNNFLLSLYFKAVELRDRAIMEIRKIDMEIAKNNETIQKSEKIISLAQQKGNTKAEMIARDALIKAQEAKRKNEEIRKEWELQKIRADRSYATIQNMLSQKNDSKQQIKGFVASYTGNVYIIKANGERVTPENGFLEPGDKVWTGDGTAEMQMLDGRATAKIGPYSEFEMKKDTPEEQVVELIKGKVYIAVDKIDEYAKKMKEKIEQYKGDLKTIKDIKEEDIEYLLEHSKFNKKFVHKCPTAVLGIRGTKYTVDVRDGNTTEINVLEGSVEVSNVKGNKKIIVEEGYGAIATRNGISDPQKIGQIERWWER